MSRIPKAARELLIKLHRGDTKQAWPPAAAKELISRGLIALVSTKIEVTPERASRIESYGLTPHGVSVAETLDKGRTGDLLRDPHHDLHARLRRLTGG